MPFDKTLSVLLTECPGVTGAAFTDLDGEDIAVQPRSQRDKLRLCAAYGGIALRRLGSAATAAGRKAPSHVAVQGDRGTFLALQVGQGYQLVLHLGPGAWLGRVLPAAGSAVKVLEANV